MRVIETKNRPIKIWASIIDPQTEQQLFNMAKMPFIHSHVAVMPDAHLGKGSTVGTVIATDGAIIPAAVGVDIGCGMAALKLPFKLDHVAEKLGEIRHDIERSVPTGRFGNKASSKRATDFVNGRDKPIGCQESKLGRALEQIGSLGGGNHFIEICGDENDGLWIVLHSGSRNIGKSLAETHIYKAKDLMKQYFISLPDPDLAYLTQETKEFKEYLHDLNWAQAYAAENRAEMLERVLKCVRYALKEERIVPELSINCHHNYTQMENHFGKNIWITRKGAVSAQQDQWGIIPGSMGTKSYIVQGKGNPQSFCSCSHGAGRIMSRTKAKEQFTMEDLAEQTAGVNCRKDAGVIDEIPSAYKPIDIVMNDQKDLVDIRYTLKQVICVKG